MAEKTPTGRDRYLGRAGEDHSRPGRDRGKARRVRKRTGQPSKRQRGGFRWIVNHVEKADSRPLARAAGTQGRGRGVVGVKEQHPGQCDGVLTRSVRSTLST